MFGGVQGNHQLERSKTGCIAEIKEKLGTTIIPGCLKHSREPFLRLYDRINQSIRRGHEVTLIITEKSPP